MPRPDTHGVFIGNPNYFSICHEGGEWERPYAGRGCEFPGCKASADHFIQIDEMIRFTCRYHLNLSLSAMGKEQ